MEINNSQGKLVADISEKGFSVLYVDSLKKGEARG